MSHKISLLKPFGAMVEATDHNAQAADLDIVMLRDLFKSQHLVLLRGFKTFADNEAFTSFCELWGEISVWPFGKVLELVEHQKPTDHIFDSSYVPMHWDGMYRPQVPEHQIFRCVSAPLSGQGGRTTFSNTLIALKNASAEEKALWQKATGTYQRKMEFYSSKTVSAIITEHPHHGFSVLRYNEPPSDEQGRFLNPPDLEFSGVDPLEAAVLHQSLKDALYSPACFYAHEWQTGDVVIADNLSLLHGREKFVSGSPRHLQRVHVLSDPPYNNPALRSHE
jgi:alpha-ketoglutarate-dependent taurine dioxygenase